MEEVRGISCTLVGASPPPPIPHLQERGWGLKPHLCIIRPGRAVKQFDAVNRMTGMLIHRFPSVLGPPFVYK